MKIINSELTTFFKDVNNITSFERRKKIYELTNNLDLDLLLDLKYEYRRFIFDKFQAYRNKNGLEFIVKMDKDIVDIILDNNDYTSIDDIKKEAFHFKDDINELLKRKIALDFNKPRFRTKNKLKFFLKHEIKVTDEDIIIDDGDFNEDVLEIAFVEPVNKEEILDLSDTTITAKIVYLEKLGVISFLRKHQPFSTSINSIASVLSAITGAKPTSIQPMLNPMLGKDIDSKNNPLNSTKTVNTVENRLLDIGFDIKKS